MFNTQSINIEEISPIYRTQKFEEELPHNGGNVISVDKDSDFGHYLVVTKSFIFTKSWEWLVVFR